MRSLELYRSATVWENFQHIEGIDTGHGSGLLGDVNNDNEVDMGDLTALINCLLGDSGDICCETCADINGDTFVTLDDMTILINILLGD